MTPKGPPPCQKPVFTTGTMNLLPTHLKAGVVYRLKIITKTAGLTLEGVPDAVMVPEQ